MNQRGILFTTLALVSACSSSGCAGRVESAPVVLSASSLCGPTSCLDVHFRRPRDDGRREFSAEWLNTDDLTMFELNTTARLIRQVPPDGWVAITPEKDEAEICSDVLVACGWVPYVDTRTIEGVEPPFGVWQDSHGNYAYLSEEVLCGPLGHCETVTEVGPSFVLTEGRQYSWSYRNETLFVCLLPCATELGSRQPTGEPTPFSALTNSHGWATWKRGAP